MHTATAHHADTSGNWFSRATHWLDERGKGAWIAAMVLGFIFVWPVGLALLAYMIWSKRLFSRSCTHSAHAPRHHGFSSSGNSAFDNYKADTISRLEDEQRAFEDFMIRLREARDKTEFDDFLDDRSKRAKETARREADLAKDDPIDA
ncbi:DUF2852 domain-containing protein [Halocynthiibacter namhaensis]|uniref:DUF2852 domain-containing protein n=1 Tax=Halocynthiibacter namhaensis TaxID=1290553 RepID=UPI0005791ED4|nr:DUF2852 domain-containing protein [Halocynthiibacter namhaensis]